MLVHACDKVTSLQQLSGWSDSSCMYCKCYCVWQRVRQAHSVTPPESDVPLCFPKPEKIMVVVCSQRCSFLHCLYGNDSHTGLCSFYSDMCWRIYGVLALIRVFCALSLRFAMHLPNIDSFLKEGLSYWPSCKLATLQIRPKETVSYWY